MNPLDLPGPDFLAIFVMLTVGAGLLTAALATWLRPGGALAARHLDLNTYEIAELAGGDPTVIEAAATALLHNQALAFDPTEDLLTVANPLPARAAPIETEVYQRCADEGGITVRTLVGARIGALEPIRSKLEALGLLLGPSDRAQVRLLPLLPLLAVALLGVAKLVVGIVRERPIGILAALLLVLGVGIALVYNRSVVRTRLGDVALEALRDRNPGLRDAVSAREDVSDIAGRDVALAASLFGFGVLASSPLGSLHLALYPQSSGLSVGSDSSSDFSGWGGGCGGGGGGGGGCGGCGG